MTDRLPHRGAVLLVATVFIATGCSLLQPRSSARSDAFPAVAIDCQGDLPLTPEQCAQWGEELLTGSEELVPRTVRLVLSASADPGQRCSADFFDAAGRQFATASTRCPNA